MKDNNRTLRELTDALILRDEQLVENERILQEILENSIDASYKRNLQTNSYDYLSPVFEKISGYSIEELKEMSIENISSLISAEDAKKVQAIIDGSLDESTIRIEYNFKHKDGTYRRFRDQFVVIKDETGKPISLIGSVSDITTFTKIETNLLRSEETRIALVETAKQLEKVAAEKEETRIALVETANRLKEIADEKEETRIALVETANWLKEIADEKEETRIALVETAKGNEVEMQQLNKVLLDSLPCVALLLRCGTREIVAMNKVAEEAGCGIGQTCYGSWPKLNEPCYFCQAKDACASCIEKHAVVENDNIVWDIHWIPVGKDLLVHYAFDITELKRAEKVLERIKTGLKETAGDTEVKKVLIIDDSEDYLSMLKIFLEHLIPGCEVFTASKGEIGIEIAIKEDPGVILLDLTMPGMNGFDVCKKLKSDVRTRDISVVFITGYSDDKTQSQAIKVGAEGFLTKPISEQELITQIRAMIKVKALHKVSMLDKESL